MGGATSVALAQMFRKAEEIVREYVAQQPEEHDLEGMLDALASIRQGDFEVSGNCLWDIWDAIGLVSNRSETPMLEEFYVMLGMIDTIRDAEG